MDKAMERIRKLLNLARDAGASEGEVENAMRMARQLMDRMGIEEKDLPPERDDNTIGEQGSHSSYRGSQPLSWVMTLARSIAHVCDCRPYHACDEKGTWRVRFIGTKRDAALAVDLYEVVRLSALSSATTRFPTSAYSYLVGFADGVWARVRKIEPGDEVKAIVRVKNTRVDEYANKLSLKTVEAPLAAVNAAYNHGKAHGSAIDLSTERRLR